MRSAAEMKKDHKNWGTSGTKWIKDGQALAMEVLEHVGQHGDSTVADSLVFAMPKGTKQTAMIEFLVNFGKLVPHPSPDKKNGKFFQFSKDKSTDLVGAAKMPWYEFQPEPEGIDVFDAQAVTLAALRKIIANSQKANSVEHGEVLSKVGDLIRELVPESAEAAGPEADPLAKLPEAEF